MQKKEKLTQLDRIYVIVATNTKGMRTSALMNVPRRHPCADTVTGAAGEFKKKNRDDLMRPAAHRRRCTALRCRARTEFWSINRNKTYKKVVFPLCVHFCFLDNFCPIGLQDRRDRDCGRERERLKQVARLPSQHWFAGHSHPFHTHFTLFTWLLNLNPTMYVFSLHIGGFVWLRLHSNYVDQVVSEKVVQHLKHWKHRWSLMLISWTALSYSVFVFCCCICLPAIF